METEEESNSIPPNPAPSEVENNSTTSATATSTATPAECEPQISTVDEPECRTEMERLSSESHESPPGGVGDSEAQPPVSNHEAEEATVVEELEEGVVTVAERSEDELAGVPGGEEESRSVEAEPLPEVTVDEREDQGDVVVVESGISGVEKGSEEEAEVKEEDNPDSIGGEEESGRLADNGDSPRENDVQVAVKEETESGVSETQEVEEFVMIEKVEKAENENNTEEEQKDLVEEMVDKKETENMQKEEVAGPPGDEIENMQKEEVAGPPGDEIENMQKEEAAEPPQDEIENLPKEEGGGQPEAALNRVSVDDVMKEMTGDGGQDTASVGRSTEEVDEMEVDDALEEKDKEGEEREELDSKEEAGKTIAEVEKEAEKVDVAIDGDNKLNEGLKGDDLNLSEVAEEDQKLSEEVVAGGEKHEEMNELDEQAEKVNLAAEEESVTRPKEEEVVDNDEEMTEVGEEDEKVNEADKEEEYEKVNEAEEEKEDEKVNEQDEQENVTQPKEEVEDNDEDMAEVGEEDDEVNESDKEEEEDEKVNEAEYEKVNEVDDDDDDDEEEEDETANEADEEDVEEEENEKVNEAEEEEEEDDNDDDEKMNEVEEAVEEGEGKEVAEVNVEEVSKTGSGKRKRGNNVKAVGKAPSRKKVEEDVCFICFDGGELVLCDRRGCPKAYHPSCVNRDEAFFKTKGKWNCGWHICSNCEKNAYYMCYTCTFSLCKGCIKDGVIFCVRGNKGFCETCFKTVKMIEMNEDGDKETTRVDFDDKSSWEYLFKDYWMDLKERLSITSDELTTAKHPRKGSDSVAAKQESGDELYDAQNDVGSASDSSAGNGELKTPKGRKGKKRLKSRAKQKDTPSKKKTVNGVGVEWASKELLEFVIHMKNGDRSVCSQFDVQALLLEYIKRNKLRDPRRKSQILCDSRLQHLFGKPRVGHFEMLKLLESHFLLKEDSQRDDVQGSVDIEANQVEGDGDALVKAGKDKKRKSRKKADGRGLQSNVDDFGAIDIHNITLIYLKRSLVEELLDDTETFNEKVVGSFVRLRISGNSQKQDLYRLVQVIGTKKADNPYRVGKRTANLLLEILNLNKTEVISIDAISNQEFTEDECKRLRQSIKCGLLDRLTVGDIQEKAIALQAVRVQDILDSEITRLSHLRDRASDMGRRKEYPFFQECVEKLQLLKSPDERQRRLEEIPEIHVDPKMDPSYESEEEDDEDDKRQVGNYRPRGSSGFSRRSREPISPRKGATNPNESWGGTRSFSSMNRELTRNSSSKGFSYRGDSTTGTSDKLNDNSWSLGRDREIQAPQSWESPKRASNVEQRSSVTADLAPRVAAQESSPAAPPATGLAQQSDSAKANETQKIWHYKDPAGKIQGPFSMVQLRKWNSTGYFPSDLRIWRATEKEEDSILLTDALDGNFQAPLVQSSSRFSAAPARDNNNNGNSSSSGRSVPTAVEIPNYPADRWNSETSLPSPTPASAGSRGGTRQARESRWSPTPAPAAAAAASQLNTVTNLSHVASPVARQAAAIAQQMHSLVQVESPRVVQANSNHLHRVPISSGTAPVVPAAMDTAALQSLVQTISNNPFLGGAQGNASNMRSGTGSQGWGGSGSMQPNNTSMPVAPPLSNNAYANWANPQTVQQPSAQLGAQVQWGGMGVPVADNPGNQTMGWGGNLPPANTNQGWGIAHVPTNQGMIPGNANPNWMQGQQVVAGNTNAGWSPAVQGWAPATPGQGAAAAQTMHTNQNSGWVGPGNANNNNNNHPSWDRGSQGGGSGYGGGRGGGDGGDMQWNSQSSSSRGPAPAYNRAQKVCRFFRENGHCRKGASCDYLHT
ncbi:unnamed protein product [Linum tenue]|uniref:RDR2-independent DNA methylation protein n=1 Tax=Linum tenue TaxID=586396 RepID=A0AAV0M156_9ROSI|nr:unnamed protein product [Linum tenue]